jgi:hypothetical protein
MLVYIFTRHFQIGFEETPIETQNLSHNHFVPIIL